MQRFQTVVVDLAKLQEYCLSPSHPRGRHKARVFRSRLGLTSTDAGALRQALLDAVNDDPDDLRVAENDRYGRRFVLDFEMTTPVGTAVIRSRWIVRAGEDMLRFVSCYVV